MCVLGADRHSAANATIVVRDGGVVFGTVEATGTGSWSLILTSAHQLGADTTITLTAVGTDIYGNSSTTSNTYVLTASRKSDGGRRIGAGSWIILFLGGRKRSGGRRLA